MVFKFRRKLKGTFWPFKQCTSGQHFSLFWFIGKGKIEWCYSDSQSFDCFYSSSWWSLIWTLGSFIGSATRAAFIQRINWILCIRRMTLSSTMCLAMWGAGSSCSLGRFVFCFKYFWNLYASLSRSPSPFIFLSECWQYFECDMMSVSSRYWWKQPFILKNIQGMSIGQNSASVTCVGSCWLPVGTAPACKSPIGLINLWSCLETG